MPDPVLTVIIGAGASASYGLPTMAKLKESIRADAAEIATQLIEAKSSLISGLPNHNAVEKLIRQFARELWISGAPSIDYFLEKNTKYDDLGRAIIALSLLPKQYQALKTWPSNDNWCEYLFQKLLIGSNDWGAVPVAFVTFNYDRILEYALFRMRLQLWNEPLEEAWEQVRRLQIVHVYGSLCKDEQVLPTMNQSLAFVRPALAEATSGIRIMSDHRDKWCHSNCVRGWVNSSRLLVFLGFGYDEINLARIGIGKGVSGWSPQGRQRILGTAMGLMNQERKDVVRNLSSTNVVLGDKQMPCLAFLKEHVPLNLRDPSL